MITTKKLKLYHKYGHIDHFARTASAEERSLLSDEDWYLIENFLQDLELIENGLASEAFTNKVNQRIAKHIDNKETLATLKEILRQ